MHPRGEREGAVCLEISITANNVTSYLRISIARLRGWRGDRAQVEQHSDRGPWVAYAGAYPRTFKFPQPGPLSALLCRP